MATADPDIAAIDLTDDSYTVEQSFVRNRYAAYDADGDRCFAASRRCSR